MDYQGDYMQDWETYLLLQEAAVAEDSTHDYLGERRKGLR